MMALALPNKKVSFVPARQSSGSDLLLKQL